MKEKSKGYKLFVAISGLFFIIAGSLLWAYKGDKFGVVFIFMGLAFQLEFIRQLWIRILCYIILGITMLSVMEIISCEFINSIIK